MFTFSSRPFGTARRLAATCFVVIAMSFPVLATAQTLATKRRANPSDPAASVPVLAYVSPLANYQRWSDVVPVDWRQANDNVMRIGGWRTYAREAREPAPPAPPASAAHSAHPGK